MTVRSKRGVGSGGLATDLFGSLRASSDPADVGTSGSGSSLPPLRRGVTGGGGGRAPPGPAPSRVARPSFPLHGASLSALPPSLSSSIALLPTHPGQLEPGAPPDVDTADDVCEYFARYGHGARVKHFHCVRAAPAGEGSPYDLRVVSPGTPDPWGRGEVYLITAAGVTQTGPDDEEPEFTRLGAWLRDQSIYTLVRQRRFFRDFLRRRVFHAWRDTAHRLRFARRRTAIADKLFHCRPAMADCLTALRGPLYELANAPAVSLPELEGAPNNDPRVARPGPSTGLGGTAPPPAQGPWTIKDFEAAQREHLAGSAHRQLQSQLGLMRTQLVRTIDDVTKAEELARAELRVLEADPSGGAQYGKSLTRSRVHRLERSAEHRRLAANADALPRLVRLADLMAVGALTEWVEGGTETLRKTLDRHALITVEVSFDDAGMQRVEPARPAVQAEIAERAVDAMVAAATGAPRLLSDAAFQPLFRASLGRRAIGPDLRSIILTSPAFGAARAGIERRLRECFGQVADRTRHLDSLTPIRDFVVGWDAKAYAAVPRLLPDFRKDLLLLRAWTQQVDDLARATPLGCLVASVSTLQTDLGHALAGATHVLRELLTRAARHECGKALRRFQGHVADLMARPTDLSGYADFLEKVLVLKQSSDELSAEARRVDDLYALLTHHGARVPEADRLAVDDLKELLAAFDRSFAESTAFVEDQRADKVVQLEAEIVDVFDSLGDVMGELRSGAFDDASGSAADVSARLGDLGATFDGLRTRAEAYERYQGLLDLDVSDYAAVKAAGREHKWHDEKWALLRSLEIDRARWESTPVAELDVTAMEERIDEIGRLCHRASKTRKDDEVVERTKRELAELKARMPLATLAAERSLKPRHWTSILAVVGVDYVPSEDATEEGDDDGDVGVDSAAAGGEGDNGVAPTEGGAAKGDAPRPPRGEPTVITLAMLEASGFVTENTLESLETVVGSAVKEANLLRALDKMESEWTSIDFRCVPFKKDYIVGGTDDIQTILDDQLVKIQAMNAQPFMKPHKERGDAWEALLSRLQDILDLMLQVQSVWMYLEPIFSSDDIVKQMPEEGAKFAEVDGTWAALMKETVATPRVTSVGRREGVLESLMEASALLEEIQKGLAAYLEKKRLFFPRFFFLSNDDMLEILSETKDPTRVQPHLRKCFEAIDRLTFDEGLNILQMKSVEGEAVDFIKPVDTVRARGAVERWLVEVEEAMTASVHDVVRRGLESYESKERHDWVLQWPGAVVLVVTAIFWTRGVIEALAAEETDKGSVAAYEQKCTSDLMKIVELVRGDLTSLQRATLGALVVMDVHSRDVCTALVAKGVDSENDFEWQAQLRTYWRPDLEGSRGNTVIMEMMSAHVEYGYEYLGNSSRLVITPLTDRCYRTLIGAIHLTLGGAPEGPAGTGKTETTKDLAKAIARQCVVFNCSDQLDYLAMGKFFKGLASSGAWACFDEFNRINLEVLSVVAQQVLDIQRAITARVHEFHFEGTQLSLRWTAWCAITMNPGYAGRSELPDNLKALFRTVAMMVPDYAMIAEIILFSYGYLNARECAKKIVLCYKLCSEQLSSQDHYDYGMRAVIAVLRAAGNLKRRYPEEDEFVLMLRSITDVNLCKFLSGDVPLFHGIVSDLFVGVKLPEPDYVDMEKAMREVCEEMNLQPTPYFLLKCTQLYEMVVVRHGLMIVGESFSGKSASHRVLASALSRMHEVDASAQDEVESCVINPKSVTMGQLYGQFDPASHEWSDGVLAVSFRRLANDRTTRRKWLILDGPVDAIWIENMNTVLDDNKKLCLNSGEIIQMSTNHSMFFEVADLAVASPATVSRCGMVYLEPHQLGWRPIVDSWLASLPPHLDLAVKARLSDLFDWLLPVSLRFLRREIREIAQTSDTNLARSLMRLVQSNLVHLGTEIPGELTSAGEPGPSTWDEGRHGELSSEDRVRHAEMAFLFSLVWSVGCTGAKYESRGVFDAFLRRAAAGQLEKDGALYLGPSGEAYGAGDDVPKTADGSSYAPFACPMIPSGTDDAPLTAFDYFFDPAGPGAWRTWTEVMDDSPIPSDAQFRKIIVPTVDTVRYTHIMKLCVRDRHPLLLVGESGTGKSVYVNRYLRTLPQDVFAPAISVNFSARTTAGATQAIIDGKLDRRPPKRLNAYGPSARRRAVVFVDDLNMPTKEVYGAQPPIELLRQWADHGGWYDRENNFRTVRDVQFVCAMGPPGGGRTTVTMRYTRHFNLVALTEQDDATLTRIFSRLLEWHAGRENFPEALAALTPKLVSATLAVYGRAVGHLLPTPTKSHYSFNLRDISRVLQGMLLAKADAFPAGPMGPAKMVRLWFHETLRVFYDRLVDDDDRGWLLSYLGELVPQHFGVSVGAALKEGGKGDQVTTDEVRSCFFGDLLDADAEDAASRRYDEMPEVPAVLQAVEEGLEDFNANTKRPMNLAIFLYAAEHVSRICRVLKQPGAHILNAGVGGSGRQSLSRLAAHLSGMPVFTVEISKTYNVPEWREDLKRFCLQAGAEDKPCVFLFSDAQVKYDSFVEDINNLLNAGEIPGLFPLEDRAAVRETTRAMAKKRHGIELEDETEQWAWFVDKTRENLRVVLCMSPVGSAFRERLRQFPSLVNCCTLNWFTPWPEDALEAVAAKFLASVDVGPDVCMSIKQACKTFHQDVQTLSADFRRVEGRINYVTPTSYLELITLFQGTLAERRDAVTKRQRRYEVGLEKLAFTADQVAVMQKELEDLIPVLTVTVKETEDLMAAVTKEKTEVVEPKKKIVDAEVAKASASAAEANGIKTECEEALAEAIPALEAAMKALNTIKPADIKLVASFSSPPQAVRDVMEAVCVMLAEKPAQVTDPASGKKSNDFWVTSKRILQDPKFVDRLKGYDRDNIDAKIIARMRTEYLVRDDFTVANAKNASSACAGMCQWIYAMSDYDRVAKIVAPKRAQLAIAEAEYTQVKGALDVKEAELAEVMAKLAEAEGKLNDSQKKKAKLEAEVELCKTKLGRAKQLIDGLGGERARWGEEAKKLALVYANLPGDVLIASGVMGYLGAFTSEYRERAVAGWIDLCKREGIPGSPNFSLVEVLGDPVLIRSWHLAGLPNDSLSIDNAIVMSNARRWPLFIDPQGQANRWIRKLEGSQLRVVKLSDPDYMRTLENAIQFGLPCLLENVGEELDPSLEPLLAKNVFKQGGTSYLQLGDSQVEYSDDFRFYISTVLRNPHYLPEVAVKVTLLNFMITSTGLSDQLLGSVVAEERPDLEERRGQLVVESAENKRKLKEIEDQILAVLSASEGNILEDEGAIKVLSEAKVVSNDIEEKQVAADATAAQIDVVRRQYAPCGAANSVLFFCIADLAGIDPMYQYSLSWFISLFVRSIRQSRDPDAPEPGATAAAEDPDATDEDRAAADAAAAAAVADRLKVIDGHFRLSLYRNVCRSLFEKDKLLFAFLLDARIMQSRSELSATDYAFLLTGGVGVDLASGVKRPSSATWLTDKAWGELRRAATAVSGLDAVLKSVVSDPDAWRDIFDATEPHRKSLPGGFSDSLPDFRKLIVVRILRPDKLASAVSDFVATTLGQPYVEPPPFDLAGSYAEASATTPLLFVLSPGSDPTAALLQFADAQGFGDRLDIISMGQGQGPKAAKLMLEARKQGRWVLLQNCHLAPSWMPELERLCEGVTADNTDPAFRLWMMSMPSPAFPISVLQNSVKMTMEPPAGLRANMRRSLGLEPLSGEAFFSGPTNRETEFRRLLFALVYLHAFVQERRKFGPIGWNIPYGFDDGDLRISARQLRMYLDSAPDNADGKLQVPFDALVYSIGECNYGGRVTDDKDRRLLMTALERSFRPAILEEKGFRLSASSVYAVPDCDTHKSMVDHIGSLPLTAEPEAFGLHDNADITKDLKDTDGMLVALISTGGASGAGGGAEGGSGPEAIAARLVADILERLPADFDLEKASNKYPVRYEESMNQVLCQEMLRYNKLTSLVRTSLMGLDKALRGLQVMSSDLDGVFQSMVVGQVPGLWKAVSFPSLKPLGSYVEDLLARLAMLKSWYDNGQPACFWLPGFFFTPAFTTATMQNFARVNKLSIDSVTWQFEMVRGKPDDVKNAPASGVYVHGLFLEGCSWDVSAQKLRESDPKVLTSDAPMIWLRPVEADQAKDVPHYACPVYRTAERRGTLATTGHSTNFLMMVKLPSDLPEHFWIMRGVAMLCSLSD